MKDRKSLKQGKGDKNRTTDYKTFCENYDLIFNKSLKKIQREQKNAEKNQSPAVDNWINEGGSL